MMTRFADLVLDEELEDIEAECRSLRLDDEETRAILARHRQAPGLLALIVEHGGDVRDFIRGRLEIRRAINTGSR